MNNKRYSPEVRERAVRWEEDWDTHNPPEGRILVQIAELGIGPSRRRSFASCRVEGLRGNLGIRNTLVF